MQWKYRCRPISGYVSCARHRKLCSGFRRGWYKRVANGLSSIWPVIDALFLRNCATVPVATTSPPRTPAPGPISIMCSALLMVSSSCSTTTMVLPFLRSLRQCFEQHTIVARMQANGRLIEDVANASKVRTQLCGQPNALGFTTMKGRGCAIK